MRATAPVVVEVEDEDEEEHGEDEDGEDDDGIAWRSADSADLEPRPARHRRDDRGQRGECEKRRAERAHEDWR